MKTALLWQLRLRNLVRKFESKRRSLLKRPKWIIALISVLSIFLFITLIHSPGKSISCLFFRSRCARYHVQILRSDLSRELTDEETMSHIVIREILNNPLARSKSPKIAFMFLTPGRLPFERLWHKFFQGHEDRFSVYIHASRGKSERVSPYFAGRDIQSQKIDWRKMSIMEAEKRLLTYALMDQDNQHFALLSERSFQHEILKSDSLFYCWIAYISNLIFLSILKIWFSCVPVQNFDYVYDYLVFTNVSYVDCFVDTGPHGSGRYSDLMLPEIEKKEFRKGSQWFTLKRKHALIVTADSLYYTKFKSHCRPNKDGGCHVKEHYLPTVFHMFDPSGIANWSVTYVDWSDRKWYSRSFRNEDITYEFLKNISTADENVRYLSDSKTTMSVSPCMWKGIRRPCYLFARKFYPETVDKLVHLFSNYTSVSS